MAEEFYGESNLELEITCAICHDYYTDPKVLPCCHYYCKQCIHSLTLRTGVDKPFSCPECCKPTTLPEGGVDDLPTAFFVNRMKAVHSNIEQAHGKVEAKCQMCSGGKAEAFCMQCTMFICGDCVKHHKKLKVFAGHKISTLEELKEGGSKNILPKPAAPNCRVHEEPMKFYCFECSSLICRDCTVEDHRDHRYKSVKMAAPKTKRQLMQHLEPLKRIKKNLMQAMELIETTESEVKAQGQSVNEDIEDAFEELQTIIEKHKQDVIAEAARKVSEKLDNLSSQKKGLSMSCEVLESVIDYTEHCVEHSADEEVMSMRKEIKSRIDKELGEQHEEGKDLKPVEEADLKAMVSCAKELRKLCLTKAKVAQFDSSTVTGEGLKSAEVDKTAEFLVVTSRKPIKQPHDDVECHLRRLTGGSITDCKVDTIKCGEYRIQYTPTVRGRHELTVTVNRREVAGSPFPVFVSIHPTKLGKPVRVIPELKHPSGIAMTSAEEIVVSEYNGDVVTLSREGSRLRSIKLSEHNLHHPRGVAVDEEDNIYFIDQDMNKICKYDTLMQTVLAKDTVERDNPGHFAVAAVSDEILVCERENKGALKVYNNKLEYVKEIKPKEGNCGNADALFSDEHGSLFITDHNGIRVMTKSGDVLRSLGCDKQGEEKLKDPVGVCVSGQYVYVSEWDNHSIRIFTTEGDYVTSFGQEGTKEGEFKHPIGLCVDKDGFLYVCDLDNKRIQVF